MARRGWRLNAADRAARDVGGELGRKTLAASSLLVIAASTWFAPAPAKAQAPPCGEPLEGITSTAPRAVRAGTLFAVESEHDGVTRVEDTEVLFADQRFPFAQAGGDTTRVVLPAPSLLGLYPLTITWLQPEQGTSCTGIEEYDIRVVPQDSRIGDTEEGRIEGRWAMSFFPANFRGRVDRRRWRWRPLCDVGACGAGVRSSSGNRLRFRYDGLYTAAGRESDRYGSCTVTRSIAGVVISRKRFAPAYRSRFEDELEVRRVVERGGLLEARTIRGVNRIYEEPIGSAARAGCPARVFRYRIFGRQL
jgi:hypothetical protein